MLDGPKMQSISEGINKGTILAGPWIGEFGHELFSWQGALRQIFNHHSGKMIVMCRMGREHLYQDFASEIIPIEVTTEDCVNEWCKKVSQETRDKIKEMYDSVEHNLLIPRRIPTKRVGTTGDYVRYGKFNEDLKYDIVVHARNIYKTPNRGEYADFDMQRNWSQEKWIELLERHKGKRIACIGTKSSALAFDGCDNYLNQSLEQTTDLLFSSKLIIGPSSGPMHLAALSNCAVVTWNNAATYERYAYQWNPFNEKLYYLKQEPVRFTKGWNSPCFGDPSVDEIDKLLNQALENEK
jgi:hypothetical protein